ncbi:MAG: type II secretion system GspH family protein [Patescibacteria group bacterium]|nr:type II secretion system GspH family protein [Patescibacteria group bacterium]
MFFLKNQPQNTIKNKKGFTLIELLIVIAILAVLMSVIVITLNPSEMLKKSRDSRRIADLAALRTALNVYLSENVFGSTADDYAYVSIPGSGGTCSQTYCGGKSCYCTATANYRNITGNGWIPVALNSVTMGTPLSSLPIDPANNSSYYYIFCASSSLTTYELNAKLEATANNSVMSNDGGTQSGWYEIGSELSILN